MKKKGTGMVMTIMLVAVFGWTAFVVFVIKPSLWFGVLIVPIGGIAIGLGIGLLIWRWWFKGIRGRLFEDVKRVHKKPKYDLGTNLVFEGGTHRYGRAGENLKKGTIVEADLAGRIAPPSEPNTLEVTSELIWGNVKAAKDVDRHGSNVLGWPEVNVKKGWYCWLKQPPLGAEFEKEK